MQWEWLKIIKKYLVNIGIMLKEMIVFKKQLKLNENSCPIEYLHDMFINFKLLHMVGYTF